MWGDDEIALGHPTTRTRYTVFGAIRRSRRNGDVLAIGGPKERAVFGTLLAADGAAVSVDALIDAVWRRTAPRSATRTIHSYIARSDVAARPVPRAGDGWL